MGKKAKDSDASGEALPVKRGTAKRAVAKDKTASAVPKPKRSTKPTATAAKTTAGKPAARKTAGKVGASKNGASNGAAAAGNGKSYTQNDIALRAYFISENRRAAGLPGDPQSDWLEAERQLREEAQGEKQPA